MSEITIKVENLSKSYLVGHNTTKSETNTFREVIVDNARSLARKTFDMFKGRPIVQGNEVEVFWALKDANFEISQGESIGIIGRNGAGKSTLLKVLSRITEPSKGRVKLNGRIASLLEVGTGFHPELSGRENIFLNGAILGMSRSEILSKFDEIVEFAEVERFLDTPVKRYSSGMYVRLAFAVAAHLEPEILIIDEVLAVGDVKFQKKCLGKMDDAAKGGRTVLFVSHNMNAIESMCSRIIQIDQGEIVNDTKDVKAGIIKYLQGDMVPGKQVSSWENSGNEYDHPTMQPLYFSVVDKDGKPLLTEVGNDEQIYFVIKLLVKIIDPSLSIGIVIYNENGDELLWSISTDGIESEWPILERGEIELRCALPQRFLNEGSYRVEINAGLHNREYILKPGYNSPSIKFQIRGGLSDSPYWLSARPGLFAPVWKWERISSGTE